MTFFSILVALLITVVAKTQLRKMTSTGNPTGGLPYSYNYCSWAQLGTEVRSSWKPDCSNIYAMEK